MSHWPLLSLVTFLPLVGVGFIMTSRGEDAIVAAIVDLSHALG